MNSESEYYIKLITKQADEIVFGKKDHDYNSTQGVQIDLLDYYKNWPVEGILHDINRKVLRLQSLLLSGREPDNESVEDNFTDLLNYVRIGYAVYKHFKVRKETIAMPMDGKKKKKKGGMGK
jgi:hypothetical protein